MTRYAKLLLFALAVNSPWFVNGVDDHTPPDCPPSISPGPTESPAPSPAPSDAPTDTQAPSESLMPSSSPSTSPPSVNPTASPTTSEPSASPTDAPTESPAPSPSPSSTPTEAPSDSPSVSLQPTMSSPPSTMPSIAPTGKPTQSPSASPSASPTTPLPTITPSSFPSTTAQTAFALGNMIVLDEVSKEMNSAKIELFEEITLEFLSEEILTAPGTASIDFQAVLFTDQSLSTRRRLNELEGPSLTITFDVEAIVRLTHSDFDLKSFLDTVFSNPEYVQSLRLMLVGSKAIHSVKQGEYDAQSTTFPVLGAVAGVVLSLTGAVFWNRYRYGEDDYPGLKNWGTSSSSDESSQDDYPDSWDESNIVESADPPETSLSSWFKPALLAMKSNIEIAETPVHHSYDESSVQDPSTSSMQSIEMGEFQLEANSFQVGKNANKPRMIPPSLLGPRKRWSPMRNKKTEDMSRKPSNVSSIGVMNEVDYLHTNNEVDLSPWSTVGSIATVKERIASLQGKRSENYISDESSVEQSI